MNPLQSFPSNVETSAAACLRATTGAWVALVGVALGGEVYGAHARVVLRQRYKNRETKSIEAVYTFPVPSDATLVGFAMECAGRRIEAEVMERDAAFTKYDDAIAKGHGAALLDQERPNVFTASVGNLLPNEETVVEVTYLQRLTADEGALRLMIPTLVAPKYIPGAPTGDRSGYGTANPTDIVPDADRITPKIGDVKYGLSMDIVFDLGRKVTIESPSHAVQTVVESETCRRVTFAAQTVALDRDIVLIAEGASGVVAGVVCDKRPGEEGTFALTLVPDLFEAKKTSNRRAVVFVIDVSGSMRGESIEQAKRALRLCLRHLGNGDLFDILPFSSKYSHFSAQIMGGKPGGSLVPFTQTTLDEADEYIESLQANGGTVMLEPFAAATDLLKGVKRDRIIVLMTDGQVGNESQLVEDMSKRAAGARIYTFGIGMNVSDLLLRELAKRTNGAVEFIHPGERIDEKVTAQFARATVARVDHVHVKWVGIDVGEVSPGNPSALVDGEPWCVYGRYETSSAGYAEIHGLLGGEPFSMEVPMDLVASAYRPALTSLWAGERVRDLVQVDEASLGRRAETHKKRIVDLCVKHGIASKYTSFVVVDKRTGQRRAQGQPAVRPVPVSAPADWNQRASHSSLPKINLKDRLGKTSTRTTHNGLDMDLALGVDSKEAVAKSAEPRSAPRAQSAPRSQSAEMHELKMAQPPADAAIAKPADVNVQAKEEKSAPLLDRAVGWAKKTLGWSKKEGNVTPAAGSGVRKVREGQAGMDLGGMFARQLASGLWGASEDSDLGRFNVTMEHLERCLHEGIDSSHAVYGAQVTKAVDAMASMAEKWALAGKHDDDVIRSLLVLAALSTGKRARTKLERIAAAAKNQPVNAIAVHLATQDGANKRLEALSM